MHKLIIISTLLLTIAMADLTINRIPVCSLTSKDSIMGKWEYTMVTNNERAHMEYILKEQGIPRWFLNAIIRYINFYKKG